LEITSAWLAPHFLRSTPSSRADREGSNRERFHVAAAMYVVSLYVVTGRQFFGGIHWPGAIKKGVDRKSVRFPKRLQSAVKGFLKFNTEYSVQRTNILFVSSYFVPGRGLLCWLKLSTP
jgi:hypothetical protein